MDPDSGRASSDPQRIASETSFASFSAISLPAMSQRAPEERTSITIDEEIVYEERAIKAALLRKSSAVPRLNGSGLKYMKSTSQVLSIYASKDFFFLIYTTYIAH
jgi:hypothetical protein